MRSSRYETLEIEQPAVRVVVVVVRIDRPEVRSAISTQTGRDLVDVFFGLGAEPDPWRCVILTGTGDSRLPHPACLMVRGNLYFATAWPRPLILTTVIGCSMPRNSAVCCSAGYGSRSACTPG
jgi:hypothetical protein